MSRTNSIESEIIKLQETLKILRSEDGCPWDRAQTIEDLASHLIDEAYELLSSVRKKDWPEAEEELGDIAYLLIFIHLLYLGKNNTPLWRIISKANQKIVRRHPHVFGNASAENTTESLIEWEKAKRKEKPNLSVMSGIPDGLPALRYAMAVSRKAVNVGFEWTDHAGIIDKLNEEIEELEEAVDRGDISHIREEIGDIFFTVVNLARKLGVDPEQAASETTRKFIRRFRLMESLARSEHRDLVEMDIEELERLWMKSKDRLK